MKVKFYLWGVCLIVLSACIPIKPMLARESTAIPTFTHTATPALTFTSIPTWVPTQTSTPVPMFTPTPESGFQGPGLIVCPILLYHHLGDSDSSGVGKYFVSEAQFASEMQILYDLGFRTITTTELANAIRHGGYLPNKPIVITFDDGYDDINTIAYPIMEQYGFVGVTYIPASYINATGYQSAEELKELLKNGWEVGSHSYSHPLLTKSNNLSLEIAQSKLIIEKAIGAPITSFAYPYGDANQQVINSIAKSYDSAVGLGPSVRQSNVFFLSRRTIIGGIDDATFVGYLHS